MSNESKRPSLGNRVENWEKSYETLDVTFSRDIRTVSNLINAVQNRMVLQDIREVIRDDPSPRVVEVGCGGARTALSLALQGMEVTCTDTAPEALSLARRNFAAHRAQGTIVQDDILAPSLAAGSFDCLMSYGLLEHFEDVRPVIRNMTGLLRQGGIQIHTIIPKKFSSRVIMDGLYFPFRLARNLLRQRDYTDIVRKSYRDFPHFENRFNTAEYARFFEGAGNRVLKCSAMGILNPFIALPSPLGDFLARTFPAALMNLMTKINRLEGSLAHALAPVIYVVGQRQ